MGTSANSASIYTGKEGGKTEVGLGGNVVNKLTSAVQGKFHCLFMDNFFTSVPLFWGLLENHIYACGTLRSDRKHLPPDMKPYSKKGLPARGDFAFRQDNSLVMTVWQDTRPVTMLSTLWDPEDTVTVKRKKVMVQQ